MNARIQAQVANAKTAELVAFYNAHAVKQVSKFADRKTAEKRVLTLIADMTAQGQFCPHCNDIANPDRGGAGITYAGQDGTAAGQRMLCHHCGTEFKSDGTAYNAPKESTHRSAAIAASWADKDVAARRAERHSVVVEGKGEFKSVREAFVRLGLPISKHIRFRMALKAAGALEFGNLMFRVQQ